MVGLWALAGAAFWTLSRRENGYATQDRILRDEVDEISRGAAAMT